MSPTDTTIPVMLESPLSLLKREADGVEKALQEINGQLGTIIAQRTRLCLVKVALDNELDRLRSLPDPANVTVDPRQLKFDLDD